MAYWGEAMTYNHPLWAEQDPAAARAVLAQSGPKSSGPPVEGTIRAGSGLAGCR